MPTTDASQSGFDGAQWMLEGVKSGKYHVVDRWTPTDNPFRQATLELMRMAEIDIKPTY